MLFHEEESCHQYDVDEFVNTTFKSITGVQAIDKKGFGWINLFLSGISKYFVILSMSNVADINITTGHDLF